MVLRKDEQESHRCFRQTSVGSHEFREFVIGFVLVESKTRIACPCTRPCSQQHSEVGLELNVSTLAQNLADGRLTSCMDEFVRLTQSQPPSSRRDPTSIFELPIASRLEAVALRFEAISSGLEAIAGRIEASTQCSCSRLGPFFGSVNRPGRS